MLDGICGKIAPGLCRLSVNGGIAVRTGAGYRTWDEKQKRLTNCDSFAIDIGEDFFFVLPTSKVRPGDIILSGGKPKCVVSADGSTITAVNFEDATMETLLPEHHIFMGNTYLYGKIVSIFGAGSGKGRKGAGRLMKYMLMSSLLKGRENGANSLLPLMLLGGKTDFMDDLFDPDGYEDDDGNENTDKEA